MGIVYDAYGQPSYVPDNPTDANTPKPGSIFNGQNIPRGINIDPGINAYLNDPNAILNTWGSNNDSRKFPTASPIGG